MILAAKLSASMAAFWRGDAATEDLQLELEALLACVSKLDG